MLPPGHQRHDHRADCGEADVMDRSSWRATAAATVTLWSWFVCAAVAADFTGPVVSVLDGDTIDVLHNGQAERIRLHGIDCPEKGQPYGKRAKRFAADLVAGKTVTVHEFGHDKYRRTIADVVLPDGTNLNRELVKAGLAWWYRKHSKDTSLGQFEAEAREAKRGLWAEPNPIPPWVYRHPALAKEEGLESGSVAQSLAILPKPGKPTEGPLIGNRHSHVYHRPDCPSYTATTPKNRVIFNSENEAEAWGIGWRAIAHDR